MDTDAHGLEDSHLTETVIGCASEISKALSLELTPRGVSAVELKCVDRARFASEHLQNASID